MASGGGPRATGSGIKEEGKFRQRVDDHYRLMASAKKTIGTAGRLQLASALSLGTTAGVAATMPEPSSIIAAVASGVLMLISGVDARGATAAAGAKDAEMHAASYSGRLRTLAVLLLTTAATIYIATELELMDPMPMPLVVACASVGLLDLVGCFLGMRGASQLLKAFEAQKAKAKAK